MEPPLYLPSTAKASPVSPTPKEDRQQVVVAAGGQAVAAPGVVAAAGLSQVRRGGSIVEYSNDNLSHLCPLHCGLLSIRSINTRIISAASCKQEPEVVLRRSISEYGRRQSDGGGSPGDNSSLNSPLKTPPPAAKRDVGRAELTETLIDDYDDEHPHHKVTKAGFQSVIEGLPITLWDFESPLRMPEMCRCKIPGTWLHSTNRDNGSSIDETSSPPSSSTSALKNITHAIRNGTIDNLCLSTSLCDECRGLIRFPLTFITIHCNSDIPNCKAFIEKVPVPSDVVLYHDVSLPSIIVVVCFSVEQERLVRGSMAMCDLTDAYHVYDVCSELFSPFVDLKEKRNKTLTIKYLERHCYNNRDRHIQHSDAYLKKICDRTTIEEGSSLKFAEELLSSGNSEPWMSVCESVPVEVDPNIEDDFIIELRPLPPGPMNLNHPLNLSTSPVSLNGLSPDVFTLPSTNTNVPYSWTPRPFCVRPRVKALVSQTLSHPRGLLSWLKTSSEEREKNNRKLFPYNVDMAIPRQLCLSSSDTLDQVRWKWNKRDDNINNITSWNTGIEINKGDMKPWLGSIRKGINALKRSNTTTNDCEDRSCVQKKDGKVKESTTKTTDITIINDSIGERATTNNNIRDGIQQPKSLLASKDEVEELMKIFLERRHMELLAKRNSEIEQLQKKLTSYQLERKDIKRKLLEGG